MYSGGHSRSLSSSEVITFAYTLPATCHPSGCLVRTIACVSYDDKDRSNANYFLSSCGCRLGRAASRNQKAKTPQPVEWRGSFYPRFPSTGITNFC